MKPRVTVKHRFDQGSVHAVATNAVKIEQLADGVLVGQVTNSILSVHDGDSTRDSCHVSARKLLFIRAPWNDINRWVSPDRTLTLAPRHAAASFFRPTS